MHENQEVDRDSARNSASGRTFEASLHRRLRRDRANWFASVVALPFDDFLKKAWEFHHDQADTFPDWHTDLFFFAWILRGHQAMAQYLERPKEALSLVERHLKAWSSAAKTRKQEPPYGFHAGDAWDDWFGIPTADARAEFVDVWSKSRFLPGHEPLVQASESAKRLRLVLPEDVAAKRPIAGGRDESDYEFFVSLAGHLQVVVGDQAIKLPCQKLSELVGVSKMTISRYRRWALEDGFLRLTRPHRFRAGGQGDATEFRFDVSRWKRLADRAQPGTEASFLEPEERSIGTISE